MKDLKLESTFCNYTKCRNILPMKKMILFLFLVISLSKNTYAQNLQDIAGTYSLRGGSHYLKPDKTFVILGYATLITGTWELKEKGLVLFTPDRPKEKFTLYGRHNKNIGDSLKIMLSNGFYDDETLLHFGALQKPVPELKRIFKPGHRHISFPYIYTTKADADFVSFSYFNYGEKSEIAEIYTFVNKENYNDFIGFYFENKHQYEPFYYQFKEGKLYYDNDSYSEKEDLETVLQENSDELAQLINNLNHLDFSPQKIFYTPLYNEFNGSDEEFNLNFEFNKHKNAWINKLNYVDNEEKSKDYDYNTINILFEYQQINDFSKQKSKIIIDEKPIFPSPYND